MTRHAGIAWCQRSLWGGLSWGVLLLVLLNVSINARSISTSWRNRVAESRMRARAETWRHCSRDEMAVPFRRNLHYTYIDICVPPGANSTAFGSWHVFKAGGSTASQMITRACDCINGTLLESFRYRSLEEMEERLGHHPVEFFAAIRDPVARFLSAYGEAFRRGSFTKIRSVRRLLAKGETPRNKIVLLEKILDLFSTAEQLAAVNDHFLPTVEFLSFAQPRQPPPPSLRFALDLTKPNATLKLWDFLSARYDLNRSGTCATPSPAELHDRHRDESYLTACYPSDRGACIAEEFQKFAPLFIIRVAELPERLVGRIRTIYAKDESCYQESELIARSLV
ncbi:uncharacterized protein MONBRDRAFT_10359 [Monosiga brevicollis MX1]|uniref:Uncharacterized protein n=1 Tax=Monosiga brevicollis TaxID=81824 RepID=A9V5Z7_MONBE|nr:uncharacterized protein MONBRDRAFT_10359 [Monosiga brevicollis MX1]EDQ86984.1 predicted protein [Monosiga brevicollis MX1]|eukprot:XP_001748223.1 hypothetical protein [Monosiga brevicollis MX1]